MRLLITPARLASRGGTMSLMRFSRFAPFVAAFAAFFAPAIAFAHEVYVLTPQEIQEGLAMPPFSPVAVAVEYFHDFAFWAVIGILTVFIVFGVSIIRPFERRLDPFFMRVKKYAPAVTRVTVGISFLAAAYYQALFGPELPFAANFGALTPAITWLLAILGVLITLGWLTRLSALVSLALFGWMTWLHGQYMLTYANYFGEIIVLLLLGAHHGSVEGAFNRFRAPAHFLDAIAKKLAPYSFVFLRICFGTALLYASLYAKFFHDYLALQVAELPLAGHAFGLAHYFGMDPHFLVLGAGIVEIVIASFFILGIEIRFTAIFLEFWLCLSLWWFGEVVWPHIVLIGIPIGFFLYGYDKYSLEGFLFKKGDAEPIL
jgi:hypothetical protein